MKIPVTTGIYAWLTPVAAVALGLLMLLAAGFHTRRHESSQTALSVLILLLVAFVGYSRWSLLQ